MYFVVGLLDGSDRLIEAESYRLDRATHRYIFIGDKADDQFVRESEVKFILRGSKKSQLTERGQEVALAHFNHVESQVTLAATTAGLVVAANALIIAAYLRIIYEYKVFLTFGYSCASLLFGLGGAFILIAFGCALYAVFPNVRSLAFKNDAENVLFFGWIGDQKVEPYQQKFMEKDARGELDTDLLCQVWAKSQWLRKMFMALQLAVVCTILGTLLSALVLLYCGHRLHI